MSDAIVLHKKSSIEMIRDLARAEGNTTLVALLERVTQLEAVNSAVKDVIIAARDFERNYTIPGKARFRRVVALRKALDELEQRIAKGRL